MNVRAETIPTLAGLGLSGGMNTTHKSTVNTPNAKHRPDPDDVRRAIDKRSYCTLATVSPTGRPHVAGVLYELCETESSGPGSFVNPALFVNTVRSSRKARNVAHSQHAAVVIPVRRAPVGPPSAVQFQTTATLLDVDDPAIVEQLEAGHLGSITGHGELELADSCFIRIALPQRLHTYGLGMPLRQLIKHPLDAAGEVRFS